MRRVVITGLGVISPIGNNKDQHFKNSLEGVNGIENIKSFDDTLFNTHRAGELKNLNPENILPKNILKEVAPASIYGMVTAKMAVQDSGLELNHVDVRRSGVCVGTCSGDQWLLENYYLDDLYQANIKEASHKVRQYPNIMLANNIARLLGFTGINTVIPTACAAGNYSIGYAFDLIRNKKIDFMIAGGIEHFARVPIGGFNRLLATAPDNVRPFDKNRKGLIPGEGAACLLLESLDSAKKRGAKIYCEILGYGLSCAANHMTSPDPDSFGRAISCAMRNSRINADEVDYISAHGTATPANDKAETSAIKQTLGQFAYKVPVSSIKSMIGHSLGAASAIEAATSAMMLEKNVIVPTINYETPDPECDLDYVPNFARDADLSLILSNSFGFGGNDTCLVLKKLK